MHPFFAAPVLKLPEHVNHSNKRIALCFTVILKSPGGI